ncbi:lmo0937 family membrane protein [Bacillus sp. JJ1609]|uniref:lmo0937 family membrane protein n=1 Tax=Bacillus sp. JJ1609 TaxID=3122977 RepID=UPI003F68A176
MLWTIAAILLVFWVLGLIFHIAGGVIHILLVIGLILIAYNAIKGRARGSRY